MDKMKFKENALKKFNDLQKSTNFSECRIEKISQIIDRTADEYKSMDASDFVDMCILIEEVS